MRKIASIVFYAFAGLLLGYTVWAFVHSGEIVSASIEAGQITVGGNLYEIISFYMGSTGQYFVSALLLAGVGILLHKGLSEKPSSFTTNKPNNLESKKNDAELDEWFEETKEA